MEKTVGYQGNKIQIKSKDLGSYVSELREYYDNYIEDSKGMGQEDNEARIYNFGDDESIPTGSVDKIEEEFLEFESIFKRLGEDGVYIENLLHKIGTKKNGKFRKKAYTVLKRTESATTPENEFTPSWGMLVLRIQALSEDEVEVYIKYEYLQ